MPSGVQLAAEVVFADPDHVIYRHDPPQCMLRWLGVSSAETGDGAA